jgi:NAD-dependent deacetylase
MERIELALAQCDLFVSIGTSGAISRVVCAIAGQYGARNALEMNLGPSDGSLYFEGENGWVGT